MDRRINSALDEYRIAKERIEVTITLVGGATMHGYIFVQPPMYGHTGHTEPAALFNDSEPFFPLELGTGEVLLVAKSRVVEVASLQMSEEDELIRTSAPMALLEITLAGGITHFGSMRLEVRTDHPRLLDYLNDCPDRFLALYTDHGVRLVNRALIECVRPLD